MQHNISHTIITLGPEEKLLTPFVSLSSICDLIYNTPFTVSGDLFYFILNPSEKA